jgi:serine protease AprX
MIDTFGDGTFRPDELVTREDLALNLYFNTSLRQSLSATPKFSDVTGNMAAIAEAVTANGSTLRDWNFTPQGVMTAAQGTFAPTATVTRFDLAIAFVRGLGLDNEAKAKAGTNVTVTYNGQTLVLADNASLPAAFRGYIQYALDKGILQAYFSLEQGPLDLQPTLKARVKAADPVTRAWLAFALSNYWQHFVAGN